ncbi:PadR family transcriptional regulator [Aurantiacibacter zhengii]|uniref:PadR family transcriptional regulator n=2 Tax=Aurantiacibacter zhengii TaxID=2307003 RepID=A0A418NVN5_9SPHN|nr:PadR family transcriptional regulator [Aurantiacibacter zhengii]
MLGMAGIFGKDGPFGPSGPFGPGGMFGKDGMFGPGGMFAKSGRPGKRYGNGARSDEAPRRRRLFGPGELRLVLLAMLAEEPRHGYELIKALEEMTAGSYSPSPGTIYPTLQMLADEGAIAEQDSKDAKKLFQATDSGLAELEDRRDELEELWNRLGRKREKARPSGSAELFRAMGNLANVIKNKAADGKLKDLDKHQVVDLIDELARKIERL